MIEKERDEQEKAKAEQAAKLAKIKPLRQAEPERLETERVSFGAERVSFGAERFKVDRTRSEDLPPRESYSIFGPKTPRLETERLESREEERLMRVLSNDRTNKFASPKTPRENDKLISPKTPRDNDRLIGPKTPRLDGDRIERTEAEKLKMEEERLERMVVRPKTPRLGGSEINNSASPSGSPSKIPLWKQRQLEKEKEEADKRDAEQQRKLHKVKSLHREG